MVQYNSPYFDISFGALADATRRGVLEQLAGADASITDLAVKFGMTLTGIKKHIRILEQAGFIATRKIGRVRTCTLGPRQLKDEAAWIAAHHALWDARFTQLDKVVADLKLKEENDDRE